MSLKARSSHVATFDVSPPKSTYEIDRMGWFDMDERSNDAIDVLKTYGTTPPRLQTLPDYASFETPWSFKAARITLRDLLWKGLIDDSCG
ncbi:hypothetical protein Tco_1258056 [Tanacetum coccineum]